MTDFNVLTTITKCQSNKVHWQCQAGQLIKCSLMQPIKLPMFIQSFKQQDKVLVFFLKWTESRTVQTSHRHRTHPSTICSTWVMPFASPQYSFTILTSMHRTAHRWHRCCTTLETSLATSHECGMWC